jgi:hypothetical protein
MQVLVRAKNSTIVGVKFTLAFSMWPVNMKTVPNATFTGVIPQTLSVIQLPQSVNAGEPQPHIV